MNYRLKQATGNDWDQIFEVKKRSIKPYVEKVYGWDDQKQRELVDKLYKIEQVKFIIIENNIVGFIQVEERETEIFLANLLIVDDYQNKGLGKQLLDDVIKKADKGHKPVKLEVFKVNERAQKFYRQSGFQIISENEIKFEMIHLTA